MDEEFDHNVFKNNPLTLESYIDKYAVVSLTNLTSVSGFIHAIDPVSESIILLTESESTTSKAILIMGSSVKKIELIESCHIKPCFNFCGTIKKEFNHEELENRKKKIINWLSRNLLSVKDTGACLEMHNGSLQIFPPYTPEDCISDSTLVLSRIQHLLTNIPQS